MKKRTIALSSCYTRKWINSKGYIPAFLWSKNTTEVIWILRYVGVNRKLKMAVINWKYLVWNLTATFDLQYSHQRWRRRCDVAEQRTPDIFCECRHLNAVDILHGSWNMSIFGLAASMLDLTRTVTSISTGGIRSYLRTHYLMRYKCFWMNSTCTW